MVKIMTRPLRDFLRIILPSASDHEWKVKLLQSWTSIMGNLASKVRLEKIEEESLTLGVFDACWMQELYLLTPMLLATINQKLDRPRIKQLRFKRVGIYACAHVQPQKKRSPITTTMRPLTRREEQALSKIADVQLCNALRSFLQRCNREKL
jgi:hypothetical protein